MSSGQDLFKREKTQEEIAWTIQDTGKAIGKLVAENARLKAELEALKPKPKSKTHKISMQINTHNRLEWCSIMDYPANLTLTFSDNVLVSACVVQKDGSWK